MKRGLYVISIVLVVLLIGLTSAGLWNDFRAFITGKASLQPTNVSVTLTGANQVNVSVDSSTVSSFNLTEAGSAEAYVIITVCDPDGVSDINSSSAEIEFVNGSTTRTGTCGDYTRINAYCGTFNCTVDFWYWDRAGNWIINASATDLGNKTRIYNDTEIAVINSLKALVIAPTQLNFTASTGDINASASNHPTIVNNTGNYNGTIALTGLHLYGVLNDTIEFGVGNFTADPLNPACSGTALDYNVSKTIVGTIANAGNLSLNDGSGQESIYYCIPLVPALPTDEYTTDKIGSWTLMY